MGIGTMLAKAADVSLDRTVVLGYTRVGSGLRATWWPDDPEPGALAGRRVLVTGGTGSFGRAFVERKDAPPSTARRGNSARRGGPRRAISEQVAGVPSQCGEGE